MAERAKAVLGGGQSFISRERLRLTPASERRQFAHVRIGTDVNKLMALGIYVLKGDTAWDVSDPASEP